MDRDSRGRFVKGHKKIGNCGFPVGNIAWNKGTKGIMKPNKTSFKIGNHPKTEFKKYNINKKHSSTRDARKKLEQVYKIKWKNMYKPKCAVIHHIDGDIDNNNFDNLCVMSRYEHCILHQHIMR